MSTEAPERPVGVDLQDSTDDARALVQAIEQDNPDARVTQMPGLVKITVDYDGRDVSIIITNPVGHAPVQSARGNRMALNNIRQRLMAHYGETAKLTTHGDGVVHTTYVSYPLGLGSGKAASAARVKLEESAEEGA